MKLQDTGLGIPWIHLFTLPEDVQCIQGHVTHMEQINEFWSCLGSKPGEKKKDVLGDGSKVMLNVLHDRPSKWSYI